MKYLTIVLLALAASSVAAEEPKAVATVSKAKVYATDKYGNRQAPAYVLQDSKLYATDRYDNRPTQAYVIQRNKIYQTDKYGNVQHHKTAIAVAPDGKVTEVDPYGNRGQQKAAIRGDRPGQTKAVNGKASSESAKK